MEAVASARIVGEEQTARLAWALAPALRPGSALLLDGPLGAGKTSFVRALAAALGSRDGVFSPTFTYENRYALRDSGLLMHVDLYRLDGAREEELLASMLEGRGEGAMLAVEWGGAWRDLLAPCLELTISIDGSSREFALTSHPPGWKHLAQLQRSWREIGAGATA